MPVIGPLVEERQVLVTEIFNLARNFLIRYSIPSLAVCSLYIQVLTHTLPDSLEFKCGVFNGCKV